MIKLQSISKKYPIVKPGEKKIQEQFEDFWALKDITLEVERGKILGIIGRNGAGKTTLLNIIAGVLSPTHGEIKINGKIIGLFNLGIGFHDELTGKENIFLNGAILGASREELDNKLNSIIEFSELGDFINMPLGSYSQGMRLRLGFSIIANLDFDILVLDEILAVGDALFQSKCYERLIDFKRSGKTLVITTQSMDLIERLCDTAALVDHGKLLFHGKPVAGINRYHALLNTEKFFVGPEKKRPIFVENTKKWAEDFSNWGNKFGTKEIMITSVEFINKFSRICNNVRTGDLLKIKVNFEIKNYLKNVHFGVAIFRNDGVYCYGPNTAFDGHDIYEIKPGKGSFTLTYKKILLAQGEYKLSIALWDKNETLAFDYYIGYYNLTVVGNNNYGDLLNIPYKIINTKNTGIFKLFPAKNLSLSLQIPNDKWGQSLWQNETKSVLLKLANKSHEEKNTFTTNEIVNCVIDFGNFVCGNKNCYLWIAFYRDDQICCQNIIYNFKKNKNLKVLFRKLPLLPGAYRISYGIWDNSLHEFIMYHHGIYKFNMVSQHQDHGTVFLDHTWQYKLPK